MGTSIFETRSSPYKMRRPCFMSRISMEKTSAASRNSSCVKNSGAGSFCSTFHHFTTPASRPSSSTVRECNMHATFKSECPSRKSPRAAEPNKITHSRFVAANSLSRFTSSVSFASVESISASNPELPQSRSRKFSYQLPEAPPPPLLPPPNPPNPPPPPPHPLEPPPNPPPPQPPPRPEFASIPSKNQPKPLPLPPPGRIPEERPRPRNENSSRIPAMIQKIGIPPPRF